jgi:hypothetical protein
MGVFGIMPYERKISCWKEENGLKTPPSNRKGCFGHLT